MVIIEERQKELIAEIVNSKPGINGVALVTEVITTFHIEEIMEDHTNPVELINIMVQEGDLKEVEYTLPTIPFRIKSVYFPKGTELTIV